MCEHSAAEMAPLAASSSAEEEALSIGLPQEVTKSSGDVTQPDTQMVADTPWPPARQNGVGKAGVEVNMTTRWRQLFSPAGVKSG